MRTLAYEYEKGCKGKVPHATEADAKRESLRMARLEREPFTTYHCMFCGKWHTAHDKSERRLRA